MELRTEYIGWVLKWPSSVAHTIFFIKYVLKRCFECLWSSIEGVYLRLGRLRTCYINNMSHSFTNRTPILTLHIWFSWKKFYGLYTRKKSTRIPGLWFRMFILQNMDIMNYRRTQIDGTFEKQYLWFNSSYMLRSSAILLFLILISYVTKMTWNLHFKSMQNNKLKTKLETFFYWIIYETSAIK